MADACSICVVRLDLGDHACLESDIPFLATVDSNPCNVGMCACVAHLALHLEPLPYGWMPTIEEMSPVPFGHVVQWVANVVTARTAMTLLRTSNIDRP